MSGSKRSLKKSEKFKRERFIETIARGIWEEIIGNYDGRTWDNDLTYEEQGSCRSTARGAIELVLTYLSKPDNVSEAMGKEELKAFKK